MQKVISGRVAITMADWRLPCLTVDTSHLRDRDGVNISGSLLRKYIGEVEDRPFSIGGCNGQWASTEFLGMEPRLQRYEPSISGYGF